MLKLLIALFLLVSCSPGAVVDKITPGDKIYKRDVKILFEGKEYVGVAVLPKRDTYQLEMTFAGTLDLVTFKTCHREVTQDDAGGGKIFGKKNKWTFTYTPVVGMETGVCPVEVAGFERDKGRHSLANIDFVSGLETLPAVLLCNGKREGFQGVSACQAYTGLLAKVIFTEPVYSVPDPECSSIPYSLDSMSWDMMISPGRCIYSFRSKSGNRPWHRLTTYGYEEIPIRSME